AAMCGASAALPQLPTRKSLPPPRNAPAMTLAISAMDVSSALSAMHRCNVSQDRAKWLMIVLPRGTFPDISGCATGRQHTGSRLPFSEIANRHRLTRRREQNARRRAFEARLNRDERLGLTARAL